MSTFYAYNDQAFEDGKQFVKTADTNLASELQAVEQFAESRMADWISVVSKDAYDQHKQAWNKAIQDMQSILNEGAIPSLDRIGENYKTVDNQARARFS